MEDSKADIGWGSQIRSYVLDASRIKDLRTGVETSNTQAVLDGDIDQFIEASLKSGLVSERAHETNSDDRHRTAAGREQADRGAARQADALREQGNAFPNDFRRTALAEHLQREYGESARKSWKQANASTRWPVA